MGYQSARWCRGIGAVVALTVGLLALPPVRGRGGARIDHVEPGDGAFQVLYSIPGVDAEMDLDSVSVTVDGEPVDATASAAGNDVASVRRTAILAVDVSKSMAGEKFEQAKLAARAFLDASPSDLYVGIVASLEKSRRSCPRRLIALPWRLSWRL